MVNMETMVFCLVILVFLVKYEMLLVEGEGWERGIGVLGEKIGDCNFLNGK